MRALPASRIQMVPSPAMANELGSTVGASRSGWNSKLDSSAPKGMVVTGSQRPGRSLRYGGSSMGGSLTTGARDGGADDGGPRGMRWGADVHPTAPIATSTATIPAEANRLTARSRPPG